jgi:hypothetical protein
METVYFEVSVYWWRTKVSEQIKVQCSTMFYAVSKGQIMQPSTAIVGQIESERGISVLCILNQHHSPLKFPHGLY